MKFVRNILEKNEHHFVKGGRFERLFPLWEAMETLILSPAKVTREGPHVRDGLDSKRFMTIVIIALIPCLLVGAFNVGYQSALANQLPTDDVLALFWKGFLVILPIIIVTYAVGLFWEISFAIIRKHEINEGFFVTGMLFPLILPPTIPLWQVAVGISFGVVIGKEVFGGTGMNILNPALTARAFLYFSYPAQISGDKVWIFSQPDGFSGATPLGVASLAEKGSDAVSHLTDTVAHFDFWHMFVGLIPGSIGETSTLACLIGAFILIFTGVGSWRIILSVITGAMATSTVLQLIPGANLPGILSLPCHYHLVMGGLMFGAVYMATDPVSATRTNLGKYFYGFLIGMLTILIRLWNPAYPEGIMLAILFMNVFAPLIDHYIVRANVRRRLKRVQA